MLALAKATMTVHHRLTQHGIIWTPKSSKMALQDTQIFFEEFLKMKKIQPEKKSSQNNANDIVEGFLHFPFVGTRFLNPG